MKVINGRKSDIIFITNNSLKIKFKDKFLFQVEAGSIVH